MGILQNIKGWWNKMYRSAVKRHFGVDGIESQTMQDANKLWMSIYQGNPPWLDAEDDVKTINFAQTICEELARLICLDVDVQFDGSRKEYMQNFYDMAIKKSLREWVEYGCSVGTIILKPNGEGVDFVTPDRFEIIQRDGNHNIRDIVFQDSYESDGKHYTKLERHHFWDANVRMPDEEEYSLVTYYTIESKAFVSKMATEIGIEIPLTDTKWAKIQPIVNITKKNDEKLTSMLFGFFKMPNANNIDLDSPLGVSIFGKAIEELRDLDIAYSRNSTEIFDSKRMVLVDERLVEMPSQKDANGKIIRRKLKLPKYARNVNSDDANSFYQEVNPSINIADRKEQIDFQLSLIGRKCGFSNGYFVLDQKTGMITATQVESDDRETIQTVKDCRDALKTCLEELLYAQSVFADLYQIAPVGDYEPIFNWGDITYNYDEDKKTWWSYVQSNKVPAWMYFVKFEGMSEEDAKAMQAEVQPKEEDLFKTE